MKYLGYTKTTINRRLPKKSEWIKLEGLVEEIVGDKLTINIASICLTENDRFSGSTSGSEFSIPITINIS